MEGIDFATFIGWYIDLQSQNNFKRYVNTNSL